MASPFLLAVPVTILPAMGVLWLFLRRYEGYFEDARIFFSLVVGFFAGIVLSFLEFQFDFGGGDFVRQAGQAPALFLFVAGYAFLEAGAKTAILGLKRFRLRKDTPYYAASLGLGMGAMMALQVVSINLNLASRPAYPDYRLLPFLGMVAVFVGGIVAHGASAVWVGQAAAEGRLARGWLQGAALQMPILFAHWLFWPSIGQGNALVVAPAALSLAWGVGILVFTQHRVLDRIVPPEIRDQVRRERRREARRKERDPQA